MEIKYKDNIYDLTAEKTDDMNTVIINGEKSGIKGRMINSHTILVESGGKTMNSSITEDNDNFYVHIDGYSFTFEKVKEEEKSFEESTQSADRDVVKPPMPGSIVKVEVEEGQKVSEGDPLIIVEAMKMETTLYSSIDGIVSEVNVKAGEQVDSDKVLLVVDKETD